jgi:NitT/TauT family transport system substrate-binding protein
MFGPRLLNEDRDVGVRFLMAYLESVRRYNEGKTDRNIDIIVERTELSRDVVARACWVPIRNDGMMQVESIVEYQKWAVGQELLDEIVPVDGFWDPSLVEEANKRLQAGE